MPPRSRNIPAVPAITPKKSTRKSADKPSKSEGKTEKVEKVDKAVEKIELVEKVEKTPEMAVEPAPAPVKAPEIVTQPSQPAPVEVAPVIVVNEPAPVAPVNGAPAAAPAPAAPQPETKRAPILTDKTQAIFREFEEVIDLPLVAYWTSTDGSICHNDVMALAQLLDNKKFSSSTVGLFLKSDGGSPEAALRLIHLLRSRFKKIVLYAPYACASAATMVALGANEVHMGPTSYLTPVDTSLKHSLSPVNSRNDMVSVSQDELSRILRLWNEQKIPGNPYPEVYKYLHPLVIGALDRSSSLSMRICMELLSFHLNNKALAKKISHELNYSYPAHSYPITAREARKLGLNVRDMGAKEASLLQRLNAHYCQMTDPIVTDYDLENNHNHEICNILEAEGKQIYYHVDKDWHYRKEERRWIVTNDKSGWRRVTLKDEKWTPEQFAMR